MTKPKRLLAKSYDRTKHGDAPPDYALLLQHSRDVADACKALSASSGKAAIFRAGLDLEPFNRFHRALVANGWIQDSQVNRKYDPDTGKVKYKDDKWTEWSSSDDVFVDDDLMGFMNAAAAKKEREEEDAEAEVSGEENNTTKSSKRKPKGKAYKRTSPLAVGRAVSLRPYRGELSFNCTVRKEDEKGNASGLSLYNAEMHTTEYQYSFGLNLNDVINKANIGHLVDAIVDPPPVAGNHSRFAYDFSPSSIVLRVTNAHSSKIQNCFEHNEETRGYTVARLIRRVESGDIPADELIIGGELAATEEGKKLSQLGATILPGVKAAADEARRRIADLGGDFTAV